MRDFLYLIETGYQLLGIRGGAKGGALCEFACACVAAPQGEHREPGL